jgi:hypothetical protein
VRHVGAGLAVALLPPVSAWPLILLLLAPETVPSPEASLPPPTRAPAPSDVPPEATSEPWRFHVLLDGGLGRGDFVVLLGGEPQSGPVRTAGLWGAVERGPLRMGLRLRLLSADMETHTEYYRRTDKLFAGSLCGVVEWHGLWAESGMGYLHTSYASNADEGSGSDTIPDLVLGVGYDLYLLPFLALRATAEWSGTALDWLIFYNVGLVIRI